MQRQINHIIQSRMTQDGDGVKLRRALTPSMEHIDPFLMLDEMSLDDEQDYIGGFPEHPHRGFETVSYMLQGKMRHRDHLGNEGLIEDGSVQWMTAGRGVIHSEMPEQTQGRLQGFQLWINLPAKDKMQPAAYQEYAASACPVVAISQDSSVKVIAGTYKNEGKDIDGPVKYIATSAHYFDITLAAGEQLKLITEPSHTVLLYCFSGSIKIAENELLQGQTAQLSAGEHVDVYTENSARFLYLSAEPIGEPVVSYGPFVMNTETEIQQAIRDYKNGQLTA